MDMAGPETAFRLGRVLHVKWEILLIVPPSGGVTWMVTGVVSGMNSSPLLDMARVTLLSRLW